MSMDFEWDIQKSATNAEKHGISFAAATALWDDDYRLEMHVQTEGEKRNIVIGRIGTQHWSAVITYRGKKVRIISVRRAREKEISYYENL